VSRPSVPVATAEQMARVDQIMMQELGVDILQLMEAAGLAVIDAVRRQLDGDVSGKRVLLLAGPGGNGSDALVAARHLLPLGALPVVVLSGPAEKLPEVTAHQQAIAAAIGVPFADGRAFDDTYDLIVDGLLGFSGHGDPRGTIADLIRQANAHPAPVLSIDLPSGLEATTGERGDPCIRATATIALVLPKQGFTTASGRAACGAVSVGDIGVPPWVLERVGIQTPAAMFAREPVVSWSGPEEGAGTQPIDPAG
jgi:hydroxyethylthiazole kinase-like uncharacterized protein yjeF